MKKTIRQLIAAAVLALPVATAVAAGGGVPLDKAPINLKDTESLQRGAQMFTNYCLSCHSANAMRYNRLLDIGLSEEQIKANILPPGAKIGDTMKISMTKADAAAWFGAAPPDLSVIARSRGADYLYSYMRSFYKDPSRETGWNNLVFDKAAMPHVFAQWQGEQVLKHEKHEGHDVPKLELVKAGTLTKLENGKANTAEYDHRMADLTNYLVFMGEPTQVKRHQLGYIVLLFLIVVMLPLAYLLKKEYWKDVH
ncbi:cytochrome c1 [Craterilacuibacter sinensis]|uniref:Cytochrome c1 n=1 Tax=Craterilacuibacter sinensis TaxID=2686017 RepID=A0A845BR37_9NEIS|nr:cytochrome c1 [Craterilacuibacter sinensis]MXR37628.1 cytochrome c1 [Craterilacuibacter sinensis]